MALNIQDKKAIVEEVMCVANESISAVTADYRGLTVAQMTSLRYKARAAGVYLRVVRNTLAKRALQGTDFECMEQSLVGPIILAFAKNEPSAAARLLRDFTKDNKELEVKALAVGQSLYDASQLNAVAELPTKEEALSMLLSVMKAPISKLVQTLAAPQIKLVRTIVAIKDQKEAQA